MENYLEFMERISSFEKQELSLGSEAFVPNPAMCDKVKPDNSFRPFYGDTVVFDLDQNDKAKIAGMVQQLYDTVPECFCERLGDTTYHMTLHDLSNSNDLDAVSEMMSKNEKCIRSFLPIESETIRMRSKAVFNMVGRSLVLGLYPINEAEYNKLMQLYLLIDKVQTLPYPLTPHITLGYYNINGFSYGSSQRLCDVVNQLNTTPIDITLSTDMLIYQHFYSMNDYRNILHLRTGSNIKL